MTADDFSPAKVFSIDSSIGDMHRRVSARPLFLPKAGFTTPYHGEVLGGN